MKDQSTKKEPPIATKITFTFSAFGVMPYNRNFNFNIEAADENEARTFLAADLEKIIKDLTTIEQI